MALVLVDRKNPKVVKITLNDPDSLNAMSLKMAEEFKGCVAALMPEASKFRAIVLTGAGCAFSAGGDLEMLKNKSKLSGEENRGLMLDFYHSFLCIRDLKVPIIAAINGHAIGAGLCLASACDIRIAVSGTKLGMTFAKLGLHPGMGATYFLPRLIGHSAASELMLTGRVIQATEAATLGLVSKVVEADQLWSEIDKTVTELQSCGPEAVRQLLESLRRETVSLEDSLQREALCQAVNYSSAEFLEGVQATIEKRAPKY